MRTLLRKYRSRLPIPLAYLWRRLLFRTTFIAITGSVGKTTAKECLAGILTAHARTLKTFSNHNEVPAVARAILQVRPWHRYAVFEIATAVPGMVRRSAHLVRPHIGIVLAVARTHTDKFPSLEDTAREKESLLEELRPDGLAILNAEDPRVKQMAGRCRCKVKMFGQSEGHDLWADQISSKWPDRLTFQANTPTEQQRIEMKLVGEHWVNSVLAALLAAQSCGIRLEAAATALSEVEPFPARMQPVLLPSGATMLRDELNGSEETWKAAFQVLENCQALRRVLVLGDVSDWHKRSIGQLLPLFLRGRKNFRKRVRHQSAPAPRGPSACNSLLEIRPFVQTLCSDSANPGNQDRTPTSLFADAGHWKTEPSQADRDLYKEAIQTIWN